MSDITAVEKQPEDAKHVSLERIDGSWRIQFFTSEEEVYFAEQAFFDAKTEHAETSADWLRIGPFLIEDLESEQAQQVAERLQKRGF